MATAVVRLRRRKNRSKKKKNKAGATTTVHDLPEQVFEQILLFLGPPPCLVRAAATCRRWCRFIADAGFIARLRLAHPHGTLLGHYHYVRYSEGFSGRRVFKPLVFVPTSPTAAVMASHCRSLALDFLPGGGGSWELVDSRGSLLLLAKSTRRRQSLYFNLVVCDPLTRLHQVFRWPRGVEICLLGEFLADGDGEAGRRLGMSNFRILGVSSEYQACVFSPGRNGGCRLVRTRIVDAQPWFKYRFLRRANGSIYWRIKGRAAALALDEATVEFSTMELPENILGAFNEDEYASRVIGGEDGAMHVVHVMNNELKVFARRRHTGGDEYEWVLEKHMGLPEDTVGPPGREESFIEQGAWIVSANAKNIILTPREKTWLFSVELDTMRVEREHEMDKHSGESYPYELPWPPVLPNTVTR